MAWENYLRIPDVGVVITLFALYIGLLAILRLFVSPLAKFPGPKLAALSNWYEFYYDVIKQGKFTAHIKELHKQYGMSIIHYAYAGRIMDD